MKRISFPLTCAALVLATGCGLTKKDDAPKVDVHVPPQDGTNLDGDKAPAAPAPAPAPAPVVADEDGLIIEVDSTYSEAQGKVGDTGVTLQRMRVWTRNPASEFASDTTGDAPDFDLRTLELWFTLSGETHTRYRKITGLRVDANGWLFPSENLDNYVARPAVDTPWRYFERKPEQAFILDEQPSLVSYERTTNVVLDALKPIVQSSLVHRITMDYGGAELGAAKNWTFAGSANLLGGEGTRKIWVKNEKVDGAYALKGKMGCLIETRNGGATGNGSFNPLSVVYQDVELGNYIWNASGNVSAPPATAACDSPRCGSYDAMDPVADDELWVQVTESFQIAGVNIAGGKAALDVVKTTSAPFYLNRELPTAFAAGVPAMSGIEKLVRQCNDASVQNAVAVSANKLLGVADTAVGPSSILATIGFRLLANGKVDQAAPHAGALFVSELTQYCDAMPDTKSPSAGLDAAYSALSIPERGIVPGVTNCATSVPRGAGIRDDLAAKPLGTVLDRYVAPGGWNGQLGRHTGAQLKTSGDATDRPAFRTQTRGVATLH